MEYFIDFHCSRLDGTFKPKWRSVAAALRWKIVRQLGGGGYILHPPTQFRPIPTTKMSRNVKNENGFAQASGVAGGTCECRGGCPPGPPCW